MKLEFATVLFLGLAAPAYAGEAVTLYSNPSCGCCKTYADDLTSKGHDVTMVPLAKSSSCISSIPNAPMSARCMPKSWRKCRR